MNRARDLLTLGRQMVSGSSAAVFRIGFGVVGLILVVRFFANDWIRLLYVEPAYHFTYPGFGWVRPLPGPGMYLVFALIGLATAGIALGWHYRMATVVFGLTLAYVELIDRSLYLNHYYWAALTAFVMFFLPLNSTFSLDAGAGRVAPAGWVPRWVVWILRFQVGMVYFFAGLAKVNSDWLMNGQPLATWLPTRSELWLAGPLLALPGIALVLAWAGALFDLTIVFWLSWKRTRTTAFFVLVAFHTITWLLFPMIGVFPLLMSLTALVFFEPDWAQRWMTDTPAPVPSTRGRPIRVALAAFYVIMMLGLPIRHYFIPGDVKLTGEGYLASWQVMLSEKSATTDFLVTDLRTGNTWRVAAPETLTPRQRMVMATDHTMLRQAAQLVADEIGGVRVTADVHMSFNGRPSRAISDTAEVLASS